MTVITKHQTPHETPTLADTALKRTGPVFRPKKGLLDHMFVNRRYTIEPESYLFEVSTRIHFLLLPFPAAFARSFPASPLAASPAPSIALPAFSST